MHDPRLLLCASAPLALFGRAAEERDVVTNLVDERGWTDLASLGNDLNRMRKLDRLACEGMKFTRVYSACPAC